MNFFFGGDTETFLTKKQLFLGIGQRESVDPDDDEEVSQ